MNQNQKTVLNSHMYSVTKAVGTAVALAALTLQAMTLQGCNEKSEPTAAPASDSAPAPAPAEASNKGEFVDKDFGFRTTTPSGWVTLPSGSVQVPGKILQVWSPGGTSSLVAFVQEAGQPVTARQLLDSSASAMKQAGNTVSLEVVTKVGGTDAMSLKLVGPGNGGALGPGIGNVPTFQHWIAIPKGNRVLVLLLTAPDASKSASETSFEWMLQNLKLD